MEIKIFATPTELAELIKEMASHSLETYEPFYNTEKDISKNIDGITINLD